MWKKNYSESRNYFRELSFKDYKNFEKKQGWYFVDKDIETTVDYMFLHNKRSKKLHILISGTHGVEGYAGSALQFQTLQNLLDKSQNLSEKDTSEQDISEQDISEQDISEQDISYLLIHSLNPYGYKNNRRFTKNNVDLNRNYLQANEFNDTSYPEEIFTLISTFLYSFQFVFLFFCTLFKFGYTKSREYIVKGQYSYKNGLFYGGEKREQNIDVLEKILSIVDYNHFTDIYIFDIHTGLGKYGNLSVMVTQDETFQSFKDAPLNSTTKMVNMCIDSMYKESKGSIIDGIRNYIVSKNIKIDSKNSKERNTKPNIYPIILEYGTYSNLQIFARLLLENYYYSITNNNSKWANESIKLKSMFYIENEDWKNLVVQNYIDFTKLLK